MNTLAYRPDIDGLRAIAVLAVVFYHYGIGSFHGGFIGVDVFFVISGYLITGIIQKEIARGSFTFAGFYERRIRRIFPALFSVMAVTLAAGGWLLLPSDLVHLGNSTVATLLFVSNVLFWRQSGYFDTSSEYNPLLHTWSLAVEEQFYIGLPILLVLLNRFAKGWLKPALIASAILSFITCVVVQPIRPSATFFLSPFRAWELLLGGLLVVGVFPPIVHRGVREVVSLLALGALIGSLLWIRAGVDFPGWRAAIPVVATAILLHLGAQGMSLVNRLLSLRPLVFIGLISYSLYLWHWPLIVFVRYRNGMEPLAPSMSWILSGVAILLAAASYRWVETPLRRRGAKDPDSVRHKVFVSAGIGCAMLAMVAVAIHLNQGWQSRFSPEVIGYDNARSPTIPYLSCSGVSPKGPTTNECVVGDKSAQRRILLWGDSYSLAWAPAFNQLGLRYGFAVELAWLGQCIPLLDISVSVSSPCKDFNRKVARRIADGGLDAVVLVASWVPYIDSASGIVLENGLVPNRSIPNNARVFADGLGSTIDLLEQHNVRTIIVGPTPGSPGDLPFKVAAAVQFGLKKPIGNAVVGSIVYNNMYWSEVSKYRDDPRVQLVDPLPWFQQDDEYRYADASGRLLYRDGGHLSLDGAEFVAERFPIDSLFSHTIHPSD